MVVIVDGGTCRATGLTVRWRSSESTCAGGALLGLTAQQVSERAGITRDTLRKIESGEPNVSFNSVIQVLRALGILDQLVDAADPLASDIGRLRAGRLTRKRAR